MVIFERGKQNKNKQQQQNDAVGTIDTRAAKATTGRAGGQESTKKLSAARAKNLSHP
jgi:hypothetical protein